MAVSPIIGGATLSRFFALHVFVIPGALLFFLAVHLWLVLKCGVSAPPVAGQQAAISGHLATISLRSNKKVYWDAKTEKVRYS